MAAVLACAACLAAGCGGPPSPDAGWPAGALLTGRTAALAELLEDLASLGQTPLARAAQQLRDALPDCEEVEARADAVPGLAGALRCAGGDAHDTSLAGLRAWRGAADLALALPVAAEGAPRLLVQADARDGGLQLALRWPPGTPGAASALLPGAEPAGPSVLSDHDPLLHARVRVDGALDLSALVPAGSQGDQLFRLKGELFGATVLDGTWELALYPLRDEAAGPGDPPPMPAVAIALGVRSRAAAEAAADALLRDVERHWSVERTPLRWGESRGACLLSLNLLPALAPCALVTPRALVLAWNPPSLERALQGAAEPSEAASIPLAHAPGSLQVDLAALHTLDRRLAAHVGEAAAAPVDWPWQRILGRGGRRDGTLAIELAFEDAHPATTGDGS